MTKLFIAEKPTMAKEIAKNLPGHKTAKDGYIETDQNVIVTWAVGHVLELAQPADYDEKYKKWNMSDLPIIPQKWQHKVKASTKKQFETIKKLALKADIIVNAGDPDREGQLLIDEILEFIGNKKPVERILLNALDEQSVKRALQDLRDNKDFQNLKLSAEARSKADWLIGMNLSRAYTIAARKAGHELILPVGRVKTPTLALVVRREEEIVNFKSIKYYLLKASFAKSITATWQPKEEQAGLDPEGRLTDKKIAEDLIAKVQNYKKIRPYGIVEKVKKENKTTPQPLLFSLSALQLLAGRIYGYDPQKVLDIAQQLYEKKVTSYPRSDCEYLPTSQLVDAESIIGNLQQIEETDLKTWAEKSDLQTKSRAWNDAKITAHHGIIPTLQKCNFQELTEEEKNIYKLVARQYLAQFYPIHEYANTQITVEYAEERFTTGGNTVTVNGWKELFSNKADNEETEQDQEDNVELQPLQEKEEIDYLASRLDEKQTVPPKRFTPATLLDAMKHIDKYVKDPEQKKQLKDVSGIGTEATRAGIIKELQDKGFMATEKKFLQPTEQGKLLISLLPDEITYPDFTAEWEDRLDKMKEGTFDISVFMDFQKDFITELCGQVSKMEIKQAEGIKCTVCQQGILRLINGSKGKFWACNRYPDCTATFPDEKGKPQLIKPAQEKCTCGGLLLQRTRASDKSKFWGCSRWKEGCKITFDDYRGKPDREGKKKANSGKKK